MVGCGVGSVALLASRTDETTKHAMQNGALAGVTVGTVVAFTPLAFTPAGILTAAGGGAVAGGITAAATTNADSADIWKAAGAGAVTGTLSSVGMNNVLSVSSAAAPFMHASIGAEEKPCSAGDYTFDCWKPILHDSSARPSNGILLKDIILDHRIKRVEITGGDVVNLPQVVLHNIWDEKYRLDFLLIYSDQLAAHAVRI